MREFHLLESTVSGLDGNYYLICTVYRRSSVSYHESYYYETTIFRGRCLGVREDEDEKVVYQSCTPGTWRNALDHHNRIVTVLVGLFMNRRQRRLRKGA